MADRSQFLNDLEKGVRTAIESALVNTWKSMPAQVVSFSAAENTVSAQITLLGQVTDEQGKITNVPYPVLIHCPVVWPKAGGFVFTLPVSVGDEVLMVFADRCIDSWWQSGGLNNQPIEARIHDLSDGFALVGVSSQPHVVPNVSTTEAHLRTMDGNTYLAITSSGVIKAVAPSGFAVTGNITATGEITALAGNPLTKVELSTHTHTGVTSGGGSSGPPTPGS